MNKYHFILVVLVCFLVLAPCTSHAISDTTSSCQKIENNLRYGNTNNPNIKSDIIRLQDFLYRQRLLNTPSTGYFGALTLSAVKRFQVKHSIPTTGFVGSLTRTKINSLNNCGEVDFTAAFSVAGPTSLKVNEQGVWTLKASDQTAGYFFYSVDWGEYATVQHVATHNTSATKTSFVQTSTFSHTYNGAGTYRITFTVRDEQSKSVFQKTITIIVVDVQQPKIKIESPNGAESWNMNSVHSIIWNITNNSNQDTRVDLYLVEELPPYQCPPNRSPCPTMPVRAPYVVDKNIAGNSRYDWIVGTDIINNPIPRGVYRMKACIAGSETNCDTSDELFTIVDSVFENNKAPVIIGISGPTTLARDQIGTWTVTGYDPEGTTLIYNGRWSASVSQAGSVGSGGVWPAGSSNVFSTSFASSTTYTFWFTVTDTAGKSTEGNMTVRVN